MGIIKRTDNQDEVKWQEFDDYLNEWYDLPN